MKRRRFDDGRDRRADWPTWVYALQEGDGLSGFAKIGMTDEITQRISELQCGNPRTITLAYALRVKRRRDAKSLEAEILSRCGGVRQSGEWVEIKIDLLRSLMCNAANEMQIDILGYAPAED